MSVRRLLKNGKEAKQRNNKIHLKTEGKGQTEVGNEVKVNKVYY